MLRLGGSKCIGPLKLGHLGLGLRLSHLGQPEGSWALSGLVTTGTGSLPPPGEAHVSVSRVVFESLTGPSGAISRQPFHVEGSKASVAEPVGGGAGPSGCSQNDAELVDGDGSTMMEASGGAMVSPKPISVTLIASLLLGLISLIFCLLMIL